MGTGTHALVVTLDEAVRGIICHHLRIFLANMPGDFDLRGASIGNLILTGGYLASEGDILSVLLLFSRFARVEKLHLRANLCWRLGGRLTTRGA